MIWLGWFLGVHPVPQGTSVMYQLWSGFIPALTVISLLGGVVAHFRHITCHVHRCWRIGRFPLADGQFKVCLRHSPHPEKLTREYILEQHDSAQ